MADNKLSWTELRRALATRADVSEKEANTFLSAFNEQLVEALRTEKQVKINGLGTFRLQPVAPRKSVNVTTGEEIIIEGYNKIAFAPEAGVKELVESIQPSVAGEQAPEEIHDPLQKLGEQAEEIIDILADLGQAPNGKVPAEEIIPEPAPAPIPEPIPEPAPEPAPEPKPEETYIPPYIPSDFPELKPKRDEDDKGGHGGRIALIFIVILLLLMLVGYFFFRDQVNQWAHAGYDRCVAWTEQFTKAPAPEEEVVVEAPAEEVAPEEEVTEEVAEEEAAPVVEEAPKEEVKPKEVRYDKYITTEYMHEASRLTWMSYRYYGDKQFWPYIYDANKDHIYNPNRIEIGTPIRIPRLTKEQLDLNNPQSRATLDRLRIAAEKAMKR